MARDLACLGVLVGLALAWFNRVLVPGLSGKTLLPFDVLYAYEPWRSLRPDVVPHNPLIGDLVLENVPWVLLIKRALAHGEVLPLWNPDILAGAPLLDGVWYPPGWLLYLLPLEDGFAWFIALHVALCGVGMYVLGRALGLRRLACLAGGVAFMCGGYVMTSATFPEVLAAVAWLPLLLAVTERIMARSGRSSHLDWALGALCIGMSMLAGHVEIAVYGLATVGVYVAFRARAWSDRLALAAMAIVGTGIAAVAIWPLAEALQSSVRVGARTAEDLAQLAWPVPQLWTLLLPDLFGNPTYRLDQHAEPVFWGTKNYVEGGNYLGVLTLVLAAYGFIKGRRDLGLLFGAIAIGSMLLALGSPLYLVLGLVPGGDQLRTPFRWIVVFSIAMSILAALGLDTLLRRPASRWVALAPAVGAAGVLGALAASVVQPEPFLKLAQRFVTDPAWAERAFGAAGPRIPQVLPSAAVFWSYERIGLLRLGVMLAVAAVVLLVVTRRSRVGAVLAMVVIAVDVYSVHGNFLPQTDVALSPLREKPPVVAAIDGFANSQPWRFTTFERGDEKTFLANSGTYYAWQDVRGYDSIISRQYADFTQQAGLTPLSLAFNRIAPVYDPGALSNDRLNLLNVRYVLTEQTIDVPTFRQVYGDAHIRAYENLAARGRAWVEGAQGSVQVVEAGVNIAQVDATVDGPATLVLSAAYAPGWRATASRADGAEQELPVARSHDALRAVELPSAGAWRVTFEYRPLSVLLGGALSVLALGTVVGVALSGVRRRSLALGSVRSAHGRPLRAPYSPAGRGA